MLVPVTFFPDIARLVNVCGIWSRGDVFLVLYSLQSLRIFAIEFDARRSVNGNVGKGLGAFSA